jgi:REP element-mobilizing transposase RayT
MKNDFISHGRSVSDLKAHLVLTTKYRKSVSSRKLRQEFESEINQVYYKSVLWNSSYFMASCGGVTISVLKKYIENQNTPL